MALEDDVKTILAADPTIAGIVDDRIYTAGTAGRFGLTAESTPDIFSTDGDVLPSILVRQRESIFDGNVRDYVYGDVSGTTVVEIYVYEDVGYTNIDAVLARCLRLLTGEIMDSSFEMEWILTTDRLKDEGALNGASVVRQDWAVSQVF